MLKDFSNLKSRYILLDIILIIFILGFLLAGISIGTGWDIKALTTEPIWLHIFNIIFTAILCWKIFRRLEKAGIEINTLIGDTSWKRQPWLMLFIIFYGIYTLESGVLHLTIFLAHLINPNLAKLAIESVRLDFNYETDSLALKFIFYLVLFFTVVIVAPVTEEFIFRGVLLHRFGAKWGITWAVLLSSFFFGLVHMNIAAISIGVGFIFVALVYIKTRTLIVPLAFHAMHNLIAFVDGIINLLSHSNSQGEITLQYLWIGLLNIAFALPILFYFLKFPKASDLLPYATARIKNEENG